MHQISTRGKLRLLMYIEICETYNFLFYIQCVDTGHQALIVKVIEIEDGETDPDPRRDENTNTDIDQDQGHQ